MARKTARHALAELRKQESPARAAHAQRFFKCEKGSYGHGDLFLGLSVPETRKLARRYRDLEEEDLAVLLASPWHEARLLALIILTDRSKRALKLGDDGALKKHFRFFCRHIRRVNNWDLVDVTVPWVVGAYLVDRDDSLRRRWLRSRSLWERRIAYVSLLHEVRVGRLDRIFDYAPQLLSDKEDLMHKALGWVLREAGKSDGPRLRAFLEKHGARMPRTALRYAIEKFNAAERGDWLKKTRS